MYLHKWMKKMFILAYLSLLMILVTGFFFYSRKNNNEINNSQYVINEVRLKVSTIIAYLETNTENYYKKNENIAILKKLCKDNDVELMTADLDGKVLFQTEEGKRQETLDLKNQIHYDLYTARINKDKFQISFPIINDDTNSQTGNAVFKIPAIYVMKKVTDWKITYNFIIFISASLFLLLLLLLLMSKIRSRLLNPIAGLKDYSEAILRGDYTQKAEYSAMDEVGEIYGMFELMRMELQTNERSREQQDKVQKELVSNISHDLKTPITTLKAYIEAIREGICIDMASVIEYMDIMQIHIDKMARLTDDLFYHYMKELGQLSVKPIERYSKELLLQIIKPIAHYVRKEEIIFIEPDEIPDVLIFADAYRLEQVISNLVNNALKHTTKGDKIQIITEIEEEKFKVTIADTGEGILSKDMPFIFNRYFQGKHTTGKLKGSNEGAGLGLSICQHIIEAHGGEISFRSVRGEGTTFYFTIPLN